MHRYTPTEIIGHGKFGRVIKARTANGDVVAIKEMRFPNIEHTTWDDVCKLPEVRALRHMAHPNVLKLKEVIRQIPPHSCDENKIEPMIYLVMEYCDRNLLGYLETRNCGELTLNEAPQGMHESEVRLIAYQLLSALAHVHKNGFIHRDVKPENIFCQGNDIDQIKLGDFGMCRWMSTDEANATQYVSTRWYRAPEICLNTATYGMPIDMWAAAAVIGEIALGRPMFPGGTPHDQIFKICSVLGTPSPIEWPEGYARANASNIEFPVSEKIPFESLFRHASPKFIDLLGHLLVYPPKNRLTAESALAHPFFAAPIRQQPIPEYRFTEKTVSSA